MKRRMLLGSMAFAVLPAMAAAPKPKVLLSVSGRIGRVNNETTETFDFTEAEFLKLGSTSITTGTPCDAHFGLCRTLADRCHAGSWRHLRHADLQDAQ